MAEAAIEALWTPVVVPRLGYCDYSCNACGRICPMQAIPALPIEEKQQQVIGKAYVNRDRCIAWSDMIGCIVCEEMCPLPEKAIKLEILQKLDSQGDLTEVQVPYVNRDLCIGCGICEYKCPVASEAAIRVFIPNLEQPI
jgi:formate hydrogenlyase subunit 6/NADH:ubiquinone oxidoreductase subunit I